MNSFRNMIYSVGGQMISILVDFAARTIFIYLMGRANVGANNVLTNVISILSLSELGISTAIIYALYKPLAEGDQAKVRALMRLYKRMYRNIGLVVAALGLMLYPFLPRLIQGYETVENLNIIYLLYLAKSVVSYWFYACNGSLLVADQKKYIQTAITTATHILTAIAQIVVLLATHNYILYLATAILWQMITQYLVSKRTYKLYPHLKEKDQSDVIDKEERQSIFRNVFALSLYKLASTVVSSTDNLIISSNAQLGLSGAATYGTYTMLLGYINSFIRQIFASSTASIGHLHSTAKPEKKHEVFRCMSFLNFWVYGVCGVCVYVLFNPFITLWLDDAAYLLDNATVILIVVSFLLRGLELTVVTYKDACGLYWKGKLRPVLNAILNLVISLWLVGPLGIKGVIIGTITSNLLTTWWFDAYLVHTRVFHISPVKYYLRFWGYFLLIAIAAAVTKWLVGYLPTHTFLGFIGAGAIALVIPNALFFFVCRNMPEFAYFMRTMRSVAGKFIKRGKSA